MNYADYEFYKNSYHGTSTEEEFARNAYRASRYLDAVTHGRAQRFDDYGDQLKAACCMVADVYTLDEKGGGVASETNGKISRTYVNGSYSGVQNENSLNGKLYNAAAVALAGTGLLSRMVDGCARCRRADYNL